jgi:RNA recognition motif-containing protein
MAKRLYVGNLAWATTDDSLRAFFSQVGPVVSAEVVKNKFDGRSKGFGFIEMESEEVAQAAIAQLNKQQLDGRMIFVNEARPPVPREQRGEYRRSAHGGGRTNGYADRGGYHHDQHADNGNDQGGY